MYVTVTLSVWLEQGQAAGAGPQVSHRGSMGKAIHLRTAQGIVGLCVQEKGRALQRVSAE